MTRLAILLCLALAGCAAPLGRLNPGAPVPYLIATHSEMRAETRGTPVAAGELVLGLCNGRHIMEREASWMPWLAAHECAHLADQRGISYRAAIALLTPPDPINEHMAKRLASMEKIADKGGDHWQAIRDTWGDQAVQHPEILARLR